MAKKECLLEWPGKEEAYLLATTPPRYKALPRPSRSLNWERTDHLYLEGDNLLGLHYLRRRLSQPVEAIYIDPPYNTGKPFLYADARSNAQWCSLIYSRLLAAYPLLAPQGVLFMSIDDRQQALLRLIADEVWGSHNFIGSFLWEKSQHFGRQKRNIYSNAEFILCYTKVEPSAPVPRLLVERHERDLEDAPLFNRSNREQILTFPAHSVRCLLADGTYTSGQSPNYKLLSPLIVEAGYNFQPFSLRFRSRWSPANLKEELAQGTTFIIKSPNLAIRALYPPRRSSPLAPRQLIFTNPRHPLATCSRFGRSVGTSERATHEFQTLLGGPLFPYPKPLSLLEYLFSLLYDPQKGEHRRSFTLLDFFSGSGASTHALWNLNALDGGKRRSIAIQLPEICPPQSPAAQSGYANICRLAQERLRRAAAQLQESHPHLGLDLGFKVYALKGAPS